jgi:bleomycin hydrolase
MKKIILIIILFIPALTLEAQERTNKKNGPYKFTIEKEIGTTDVKNQHKSGTCWCFSTESFLESELMRMGKTNVDLSEMFIVRNAYSLKAKNYIRMMGTNNFGPGGAFHDVVNGVKQFGIVPQQAYSGFPKGQVKPTHGELDAVLKSMLDAMLKLPDGKLSPSWYDAYEGALDGYFGKVPATFDFNGKQYTPQSFAQYLGINADDYVELSSFTHHPFYEKFIIEVPDNWSHDMAYNLPLNELQQVVDNALANNYSIAWGSDVSEPGFSFKEGLAIVPEKDEELKKEDRDSLFSKPRKEKVITQELRQIAFDNLSTQDDHGMHITGVAKDQNGSRYYIVKNSWGLDNNDCAGYFYCSVPYFLYKTTSIMVHKNAIPKEIAAKLKIAK